MLRTNRQNLVEKAVFAAVSYPRMALKNPWLVDPEGSPHVLPGTGGITYNVVVGDSALDFAGDHVEPCVSLTVAKDESDRSALGGLSILACIGNEARVTGGQAAGARGVVTGKHGGVEHVLVDFAPAAVEKLVGGDAILIRACGQGLLLKDFPEVCAMNIDPGLLARFGITVSEKRLVVPVTHAIPASIMGSGLGSKHSYSGDFDIQLADAGVVRKFGLQNLRIGDVVAINDADCRFGRSMRPGAVTIGVVVHGACITSGHGPGVTIVMTTPRALIVPEIEAGANISFYLGIGRGRRSGAGPRGAHRRQRPRET